MIGLVLVAVLVSELRPPLFDDGDEDDHEDEDGARSSFERCGYDLCTY